MQIIQVSLQNIKYYERNNKKHPPEQIRQLMNAISEFGFVNPVLLDDDNVLIAGHGRTEAAKTLNLTEIPAIRLSGLSDSQKKALRIADNKIAENSAWDTEALAFELQLLADDGFDMDLLGFSDEELERLTADVDNLSTEAVEVTPKPKRSRIIIDCTESEAEALNIEINSLINSKKYDAETNLIK
jgi:ParB-like chromosome segregation protein Spo0J